MTNNREQLPGRYESRYKSELLKSRIADEGMWFFIPGVNGNMESKEGLRRLKENDPLFLFIDQYFSDQPYAFEPNMQDGRFVFLPEDVGHQGVGICASKDFPGFLEVGNFWYPREFTEKDVAFPVDQVYVSMFCMKPEQLVELVQNVYMKKRDSDGERYCTFVFSPNAIVTLKGPFLDRLEQSVKEIRRALKDEAPGIKRNGEGLIMFMKRVVG